MSKDSYNWTLTVSGKIYGRLLSAYPKAHREEYGTAMAQLFHDQCRDAWNEARGLGVMKLWLRVLPDLVKTSIIERFAALTERKSMSDKIAALIQPRTIFLKVFATVFLIILCGTVAVTFILPESYASTAQINVGQETNLRPGPPVYDPYFLETGCETIKSQPILIPVIDKLNLNDKWGKKYGVGALKTSETLALLQNMMALSPVRNTMLLDVTVYSADKIEAAQIANAIVESYQNYRVKTHAELEEKGIVALQQEYQKQEAQIGQAQSDVDSLAQKFKIASDVSGGQPPQEQPYLEMKRSLQQLLDSHKLLGAKIETERVDMLLPKIPIAEITKLAEPGREPVRPNKPLNITLGAVGGIFLALILGGIAALTAFLIRKRIPKNSATT